MESLLRKEKRKKKKKATVGRICRKGRFKPGMKECAVMDDESGESMEPIEEISVTRTIMDSLFTMCVYRCKMYLMSKQTKKQTNLGLWSAEVCGCRYSCRISTKRI